jgi:hypothetical protein
MPSPNRAPRPTRHLAVPLLWAAALCSPPARAQESGAAGPVLDLGAPLGRADAIWVHFPTGAFELEAREAAAAELAIAAWNAGPGGRTQERFAGLGGSFELRLEGARCWLEARVASDRLEQGFEALLEALSHPAAELDGAAAAIDAATLRARRPPERQLEDAALGQLWRAPAPAPSERPTAELEAAAVRLFAGATLGVASALPSERWRPWAERAATALAQRFPGPASSAPPRPAAAFPERLWLPRQEPGPEHLLLAFEAPAGWALDAGGWDLAAALERGAAGERLRALLAEPAAPRLGVLETPAGPKLAVRWSGVQQQPEPLLAALLAWLGAPSTWAAAGRFADDGQRTPAERRLLEAAEGPRPEIEADAEAWAAIFRAEPQIVAWLAPAAAAAHSEAGAGVRRLDGSPWQQGSAAGRRTARALAEALGPLAALEQLEVELEFAPAGRAPLRLRQKRGLAALELEVWSGPAEGPADAPMLQLSSNESARFEGGRRLPLEGSALSDAIESERRAWSRLLADLDAQGPLALEPAAPGSWTVWDQRGPLALLTLGPDGLPQSLTGLPSGRSTQFEAWAWREVAPGVRLRLPESYRTDAGRFVLRAAAARAASEARRGPAVDSEPPPPPRWGEPPPEEG